MTEDSSRAAWLQRRGHSRTAAQVAHGQHSPVPKILEIHRELPGLIHIVTIRQPAGF